MEEIHGISEGNLESEIQEEDHELIVQDGSEGRIRFAALVLLCLIGFGPYFCYDNPGALQERFLKDLKLTTSQFADLYSWYYWPNSVLCLVGGFLLDRVFGLRKGTIIFCTVLSIGQIIFALGAYLNMFWLMILGRLLFGIGCESLVIATSAYTVRWFEGKELNMVFGLQASIALGTSTLNFNLMDTLYKWANKSFKGYECLGIVLFLAATTCLITLLCSIAMAILDLGKNSRRREPLERISLKELIHFPQNFWLLCASCVTYLLAIFPFIGLGKVFFQKKFGYTPQQADTVCSMLYILGAIFSPFCGILVDKTGNNEIYVGFSIFLTIIGHSLLAFTFNSPYVGMVFIGLSHSMLASAVWPMVSQLVSENQLATAYGIIQSLQNLGLASMINIPGVIADKGGYFLLEVFFLVWLFVSLATMIRLVIRMYSL